MKIILLLFTVMFFPEPSSAMEFGDFEEVRPGRKAMAAERYFRGRQSKLRTRRRASETSTKGDPWKIRRRAERKAGRSLTPTELGEERPEDPLFRAYRQATMARGAAHREAFSEINAARTASEREAARHADSARRAENRVIREFVESHRSLRSHSAPAARAIGLRDRSDVDTLIDTGLTRPEAVTVNRMGFLRRPFLEGLIDSDGTKVGTAKDLRTFMLIEYQTLNPTLTDYIQSEEFRTAIKGKTFDQAKALILAKAEEEVSG